MKPFADQSPESGRSLSVEQENYLEAQMNLVSRSFAVVVGCLEQPLRAQFATAYLLCRVADNIEDCAAATAWKADRFAEFERSLAEPDRAPDLLVAWQAAPWSGLTPDERGLMGGSGAELWRIYAAIPPVQRAVIRRWVWAMSEGMIHLDEPGREPIFLDVGGISVLARPVDYNHYCYIVAGTVGRMATELVAERYGIDGAVRGRLLEASEACGRALQKTNILKDFAEDLQRGVCYLPDEWLQMGDRSPLAFGGAPLSFKQIVFEDLLAELDAATQYVRDLPREAGDYRLASLLCLLPALQTNLLAAREADRLFTADHRYKISRVTLGQCMLDARRMIGDNAGILAYSRGLQKEIRHALLNARKE
jgi:farnesyl-diphosphate farnesyltransferase